MNKTDEPSRAAERLPRAKIQPSRMGRLLWLVPLGAAALCVWFVFRDFVATGPVITVYFENAEGLEEQNTHLEFRGAQVGQVKTIRLTSDKKHVAVKARLTGSAKPLARAGTIFWIVRPEVKVGALSGLGTIISGVYIAVQPGNGPATNAFTGAEKEPVPEQPGALQISLLAPSLGSLQDQSPVFYRGIQVGEVLAYQLAADARQVVIRARIWADYAPLVRPESKFWNAGGFDVHVGLFKGIQIGAESTKTIFSGGIEFATPPDAQKPAANGTTFDLNEKAKDEWKTWTPVIPLHLPAQAVGSTNGQPGSLLQ